MPDLDVVIPVYNEGDNILNVLNALCDATSASFRVLICYDEASDDTLEALKDFKDDRCEIVKVRNRGRGAHGAVVTGFDESDAPAAIMWPADDAYNAGIIDTMYREYLKGSHVVCAGRFIDGGCMVGAPWLKSLLVRSSAFTLYYLARLPARDATNGLRLFSRRLLDRARIESSAGFAYGIELLVKCHRLGWKIAEVPAVWRERTTGRSRFRVIRWLPEYLRWYFYAFATTYLGRGPATVPKRDARMPDMNRGAEP